MGFFFKRPSALILSAKFILIFIKLTKIKALTTSDILNVDRFYGTIWDTRLMISQKVTNATIENSL